MANKKDGAIRRAANLEHKLKKDKPISLQRACERLFGVVDVKHVPPMSRWIAWKVPPKPLAIDKYLRELQGARSGVRLKKRSALDRVAGVPRFCPYYHSRIRILEAVKLAGEASDRESDWSPLKDRLLYTRGNATDIATSLDHFMKDFQDYLSAFSIVSRVPEDGDGTVDLDAMRKSAETSTAILQSLRRTAAGTISDLRSLARFAEGELSRSGLADRKGAPKNVWGRTFIESVGRLYFFLTGAAPAQSAIFFGFVNAAYKSIGISGDHARQIRAVLCAKRIHRTLLQSNHLIRSSSGEVFKKGAMSDEQWRARWCGYAALAVGGNVEATLLLRIGKAIYGDAIRPFVVSAFPAYDHLEPAGPDDVKQLNRSGVP